MASTRLLAPVHVDEVRRQLRELMLVFHSQYLKQASPVLGDSFELHELAPVTAAADGSAPVTSESIALKTNMWHHQLLSGGRAVAVARSHEDAGGAITVLNFFISNRAEKFASAIQQLDRERPDDAIEVKLVVSLNYQMDLFLLKSPTKAEVHVISAPSEARELVEGSYYEFDEFLERLGRSPKPRGWA